MNWKELRLIAIKVEDTTALLLEAATWGVLRNFTKFTETTCARASFLIKLQAWGEISKNIFCEISKNTFFYEHVQLYLKRDSGTGVFQRNSRNY